MSILQKDPDSKKASNTAQGDAGENKGRVFVGGGRRLGRPSRYEVLDEWDIPFTDLTPRNRLDLLAFR
jgi:hypothetical protein